MTTLQKEEEVLRWLLESHDAALEELWAQADACRKLHVGDEVHLRGLVELSNHCARQCTYCGVRAGNARLTRYRLSVAEVMSSAALASRLGYGTLVLQSGEDFGLSGPWVTGLIRRIKGETGLAVTLSLGERDRADLAAWREAGADRYLLRFETSNRALFDRIHPPLGARASDRLALLSLLRRLGYEIGSGVMIGIPGQSYADLAADIALFAELDLDMIGVGPFLAHPDTPLGQMAACDMEVPSAPAAAAAASRADAPPGPSSQVPATELMTYKVLALARLVCPDANIPSTTALATLNAERGRELGLARGANIVMPNVTPAEVRRYYEIYPAKACLTETAEAFHLSLMKRIQALGRVIGAGPGPSPAMRQRARR